MTFETDGYVGKTKKTLTVHSNDPKHKNIILTLTGEVGKIASLSPNRVMLRGPATAPISESVTITPKIDIPFNIVKVEPLYGKDFRYSIESVKMSGVKSYRLKVENTRRTPGRYYDQLTFTTDRNKLPTFSIMIYGDIR